MDENSDGGTHAPPAPRCPWDSQTYVCTASGLYPLGRLDVRDGEAHFFFTLPSYKKGFYFGRSIPNLRQVLLPEIKPPNNIISFSLKGWHAEQGMFFSLSGTRALPFGALSATKSPTVTCYSLSSLITSSAKAKSKSYHLKSWSLQCAFCWPLQPHSINLALSNLLRSSLSPVFINFWLIHALFCASLFILLTTLFNA